MRPCSTRRGLRMHEAERLSRVFGAGPDVSSALYELARTERPQIIMLGSRSSPIAALLSYSSHRAPTTLMRDAMLQAPPIPVQAPSMPLLQRHLTSARELYLRFGAPLRSGSATSAPLLPLMSDAPNAPSQPFSQTSSSAPHPPSTEPGLQ